MGILLASCAYGAYVVFTYRIVWRIVLLCGPSPRRERNAVLRGQTALALAKSMGDIFLLSRLFRTNPRLWIGEWIFHLSFLLVILRHLRYIVNPVPEWVFALQPVGICAGYVLPFSFLYILSVKLALEKKKYLSSFNFFFLGLLLIISFTGLLMRIIVRPDIVRIKDFMIGIFTFAPGISPEGCLFGLHFIVAFVFLVCLPTHIFAAPFSVLNARQRDAGLKSLLHGG